MLFVVLRDLSQTFSPYTNALFSLLHFTCLEWWHNIYGKIALKLGVLRESPYKPASHYEFDDNINFGRVGTMFKYRSIYQETLPQKNWNMYIDYLKRKGQENGVDYFELYK